MADQGMGAQTKNVPKVNTGGTDLGKTQNNILLDLPRKERQSILSKLEHVELPAHTKLAEMAEPIKFAYFLNDGVASIMTVMSDGKSVEVGLTGKEGFVGLPLIVDYATSPTRTVIQIAGDGFRISAQDFKNVLRNCPKLERSLHRYSQELAIQTIQIAACNRLHSVDKRLARWLLMSQDRLNRGSFHLTQQFVSHMLGTRRASVTVAAGTLQKAGLITYKRGLVTIVNRAGLQLASCECYRTIKRLTAIWK